MRKPVFGVSDQVRHKPGCAAKEDSKRLEISDLERSGIVLSAQLIFVFVFAYAKSRFSHDEAQIYMMSQAYRKSNIMIIIQLYRKTLRATWNVLENE